MFITKKQRERRKRIERERKRRKERERKERERKEREKKEREKRIEEERRNAPLEYNDESWQIKRCLKIISLNENVKLLINILQLKRQDIIENDKNELDKYLENISRKYELQRKRVESAIKILENLNVNVSGSEYRFSRVGMFNLVGSLDMKLDYFGEVFSPNMKKGIRINEEILSSDNVYKLAYERLKPEETQQQYDEVTKKVNKYKKIGKYLKFILSKDEYRYLVIRQRQLAENLEYVNEAKENLDSYNSLTKIQLETIKNYLNELNELLKISSIINRTYEARDSLKYNFSDEICKRSLVLAIADEELKPLVIEAMQYIQKICLNDEQIMTEGKRILDENQEKEIENHRLCDFLLSNRDLILNELNSQKQYIKK